MSSDCRFYEKKFPDVDELVMVQVRRVAEMGAYVALLEYENKEGMILLSELSKRRIRSVAKLVRVGRFEVCSILRVDQEKGYIDLSKRKVSALEITKCEENFAHAKQVHSIMRQMATTYPEWSVETWNEKVAWPLDRLHKSCYFAFKKWINEEEDVSAALDISDEMKKSLDAAVRKRMLSSAMKMCAKVEVSCLEYEGIDAVKDALKSGYKASTKECVLQIKLIAPPQYAIVTTGMDKELASKKIEEAIGYIKETIESRGGTFSIKAKPEIVGDLEEQETKTGDHSESESGSESGSDSEDEQDETMGNVVIDEAFLKKTEGADDDSD